MQFVDGFFRITSHLLDAFYLYVEFHKTENLIQAPFKVRALWICPFWFWRII